MNESFADGFEKAPWDEKPRLLKVTTPMMEGTDIFNVQKALQKKGFNIEPDGYFGKGTSEIVKQFQKQAGVIKYKMALLGVVMSGVTKDLPIAD